MHRIGRHRTNDIIVDDATVSRHHAELTKATDGRYYLVDVDNLDEAIAIAERLPPATIGTVEVRPLHPLPTLSE